MGALAFILSLFKGKKFCASHFADRSFSACPALSLSQREQDTPQDKQQRPRCCHFPEARFRPS